MFYFRRELSLVLSFTAFAAILPCPRPAAAQDLVANETVAGGSSVFVFRESRKKPQVHAAGGSVFSREAVGGGPSAKARSSRTNSQIASAAAARRAAAAKRRAAAVAAANRKIALSNTLTAKAEGFLDNNQTDTAITNYRAALVQNPKNKRAADGLSDALTAKGIETAGDTNNTAAIVYFDEAVKYDKNNDVAYAKLGSIYDAGGQNDKAIANYEKAVAINPQYSMLYAPLGIAYADTGEVAKAETALQKSDAAGVDTVESRFLKGILLYAQNKNDEAIAAFDRTLEMDKQFAPAQYFRGLAFDRAGKTDQAIVAYKGATEIAPGLTAASFNLGVDYYNTGDYPNAAAAYQQTIKNDPNNAQAHANLASTYRQMERYPDANAEYKTAADNGAKSPDLYSEWGYCLGKTNEWDKSTARLDTAKEMSPTAIDESNAGWAYYNKGTTEAAAKDDAAAKQDYAKAKTNLESATKKDPKLDAAYLNLGSTHNALGEFQLAVSVLQTALGLHSGWVLASNQLGVGYRGMGDLVNAVAVFKQVVALDGRNTFGLYGLGEAYNASGNKKEAKKVNDKLKKIDPTLGSRLDNVIAGKAIDAATQEIKKKVPVPKIPGIPRPF